MSARDAAYAVVEDDRASLADTAFACVCVSHGPPSPPSGSTATT